MSALPLSAFVDDAEVDRFAKAAWEWSLDHCDEHRSWEQVKVAYRDMAVYQLSRVYGMTP